MADDYYEGPYRFYGFSPGSYLSLGVELNWPEGLIDVHLPFGQIRFGRRCGGDDEAKKPAHRRWGLLYLDTTDFDLGPGVWVEVHLSLHDWWVGIDVDCDTHVDCDTRQEIDITVGLPGLRISAGGRTSR